MELTLLFLFFLLSAVAALGTGYALGFASALFYGWWYWSRAESIGTAPAYWPAARRWANTILPYHTFRLPETPLPPGPLLYACRPHGILVVSAWLTFLTGRMDSSRPGQKPTLLAVHSIIFKLPVLRELALALGCIDVGRESILAALAQGYRVAVLPGGVREMAGMPESSDPPGIVRLAHEYKVPLVAVYFGGEAELCWVWAGEPAWLKHLREWLIRKTRAPFPLFFVPRVWRWPRLVTVVGEALRDEDSFNHVFDMYKQSLVSK
jgi:1-acyl-sn-glycerol-3-phosphate acyltransferase